MYFIHSHQLARVFSLITFYSTIQPALAQFGVKKPKEDAPQQQQQQQRQQQSKSMEADVDFSDPELMEAMDIFAGMSKEEMQETLAELMDILGDDPETLAAIQELQKELETMQASGEYDGFAGEKLEDSMVTEDELAAATQDALHMLGGATDWDGIWEMQEVILQGVLESGQLSAEDAALYKNDLSEWEKELQFIWTELQNQAQLQKEFQKEQQEL
jgi:hypothetical protein